MKRAGRISSGVLLLSFGFLAPGFAQPQEHENKGKPERQEERPQAPQQARPQGQEHPQQPNRQQPKPQQPAHPQPQPQRQPAPGGRQEQKPAPQPARGRQERATPQQPAPKVEPRQQQPQARNPKDLAQPVRNPQQAGRAPQPAPRVAQSQQPAVWQQRRAGNWQSEHRTWQQRGGYQGYRIPQATFRGRYGSSHGFRMSSFPLMLIGGFPRFQFGGLWFSVMDPWPEYWSNNWYTNDDMYVDFVDDGYYLFNRRYPGDRIALTVYLN